MAGRAAVWGVLWGVRWRDRARAREGWYVESAGGCGGRCRRADAWHEVAAIEAEVIAGRAFAEGYLEGFLAAIGPQGRTQAGYAAARYADRCAEVEAARVRVRACSARSPGWPQEFPGGWPIPPTYVDPGAPPMRCSRDGWPIPPQLLEGK